MDLRRRIEKHLNESGTAPSRFGRDVLGDPGFVSDLRQGRELRPRTARRLTHYLDQLDRKRNDAKQPN